jgi:hypothetical protein
MPSRICLVESFHDIQHTQFNHLQDGPKADSAWICSYSVYLQRGHYGIQKLLVIHPRVSRRFDTGAKVLCVIARRARQAGIDAAISLFLVDIICKRDCRAPYGRSQ